MYRVKNKLTNKIYYFRFFSPRGRRKFWFTKTTESVGFDYGNIEDFIPLDKSWEEIYQSHQK